MSSELNYKAAANHLAVPEHRLRRLCAEGKGPKCRRDGRTVHFLEKHLDEWAEQFQKDAYTVQPPRAKTPRKARSTVPAPKATGRRVAKSAPADIGV